MHYFVYNRGDLYIMICDVRIKQKKKPARRYAGRVSKEYFYYTMLFFHCRHGD